MKQKFLLSTAIEAVTAFALAFGGVLLKIAPPSESGATGQENINVGLTLFAALIALLVIKLAIILIKNDTLIKYIWLGLAAVVGTISIFGGLQYVEKLSDLTFWYPPRTGSAANAQQHFRLVQGELTHYWKDALDNPDIEDMATFFDAHAVDGHPLFTDVSVDQNRNTLRRSYLFFVTLLALAIFMLEEGIIWQTRKKGA